MTDFCEKIGDRFPVKNKCQKFQPYTESFQWKI
jgi:hypothetical protein